MATEDLVPSVLLEEAKRADGALTLDGIGLRYQCEETSGSRSPQVQGEQTPRAN